MHHHYKDIRDRIPEEPTWFDENGTPRYCAFSPRETADIYADEAVLLGITCQSCGHRFKVAMTSSHSSLMVAAISRLPRRSEAQPDLTPDEKAEVDKALANTLAQQIRERTIHYGDPPNACPHENGMCAGATMNSEPRKVLEYWRKDETIWEWVRERDLEMHVEPDWVEEG